MICIPLTPVLTVLYIVIIEVYLQCFIESLSLRSICKPTSRSKTSRPSSLSFKAVKAAHLGSALNCATSELTNSCRKQSSRKHIVLFSKIKLRSSSYFFMLFLHLKFREAGAQPQQIYRIIEPKYKY